MAEMVLPAPGMGSAFGLKQLDRSHKERHSRSLRNVVVRIESSELCSHADGKLLSLRYVATNVGAGRKQ